MIDITLKIEGMSCQHCVMSVEKALRSVEGIQSADVSVGNVKAVYDESKTDPEAIVNAVQAAGYKVVN